MKNLNNGLKKSFINKTVLGMLIFISLIYLILLMKIIFFKYVSFPDVFNDMDSELRSVNIIPFRDFIYMFSGEEGIFNGIKNYGGNIGIFIPFGILIPLFNKKINNIFKLISISFIASLCIEILQYYLCLGASDIDDVIMNISGAVLGYIIFYLLTKNDSEILNIRIKSFIALCIIGMIGVIAIYNTSSNIIVKQKVVEINKEVLGDLSEVPDIEAKIDKVENNKIDFAIYKYDEDTEKQILSEIKSYNLTESTKFFCKEIKCTYTPGKQSISKVEGIYNELNKEEFFKETDIECNKWIEIWTDGESVKAMMITKNINE